MSGDKLQVLVVDDDKDVASAIQQVLESANIDVKLSHGSEEALTIMRSGDFKPDALIVDLLMPGTNGLALIKEVRSMKNPWNHIPIVVSSAVSDTRVAQAASTFGLHAFLVKPWRAEELIDTIKQSNLPRITLEQIREFLGSSRLNDQSLVQISAFKHLQHASARLYPITSKDHHFVLIALGEAANDIAKTDEATWCKKVQIYHKKINGSWEYVWPRLRDIK